MLERALSEAKGEKVREVEGRLGVMALEDWKGEGKRKEKMSSWDRLKFALGGEEELQELLRSVETAKSNLALLLDWVNLFVLRELGKKHLLDDDQAGDLKLLVMHLPMLIKGLKGAGLVPSEPKNPQPEEKEVIDRDMDIGIAKDGTAKRVPGVVGSEIVETTYPPTDDFTAFLTSEKGGFWKGKKIVVAPPPPPPESNPSLERRQVMHTLLSLDNRSFYEGWVLEHTVKTSKPDSMLLVCGVKFRTFQEEYKRHKYTILPLSKDKSKLEKYILKGDKIEKGIDKAAFHDTVINRMPKEARREIMALLRDRNHEAKPYGWRIVALDSNFGMESRLRFWKKFLPKPTKWLVVLRGGIVEMDDDKNANADLPDRHSTPWEVSTSSRSRVDDVSSITESDSSSDSSSITRRRSYRVKRNQARFRNAPRPARQTVYVEERNSYRAADPNTYGGPVKATRWPGRRGNSEERDFVARPIKTPSEILRIQVSNDLCDERSPDEIASNISLGRYPRPDSGAEDVVLGDGEAELLMDELLANFTVEN